MLYNIDKPLMVTKPVLLEYRANGDNTDILTVV